MYNKNNNKVSTRKRQLFYARVKPNNNKIMRSQVIILLLYIDNNGSFKEYLMMITSFNTVNYHLKIFNLLFLYVKI